jgi:hypothetical protein
MVTLTNHHDQFVMASSSAAVILRDPLASEYLIQYASMHEHSTLSRNVVVDASTCSSPHFALLSVPSFLSLHQSTRIDSKLGLYQSTALDCNNSPAEFFVA